MGVTREETLESKIHIILETMDMIEQAIKDWKGLSPEKHLEFVAMIEALARVEAAICYEKRLLAKLERTQEKENPRQ